MNKAILIGNLTRDVDLRTIPSSGKAVASFTLAIQRQFKNQQGEREVDFIPVVVWGKQGENCAKYLRKGSKCAVEGSIQTRTYEAQDKTKRYVTEVIANEVEFLDGRQAAQEQPATTLSAMQPIDPSEIPDMPF